MTARRALVNVSGAIQELPSGDSLVGGGGDLLAANNLSDVASAATARSNLSVMSRGQAVAASMERGFG